MWSFYDDKEIVLYDRILLKKTESRVRIKI